MLQILGRSKSFFVILCHCPFSDFPARCRWALSVVCHSLVFFLSSELTCVCHFCHFCVISSSFHSPFSVLVLPAGSILQPAHRAQCHAAAVRGARETEKRHMLPLAGHSAAKTQRECTGLSSGLKARGEGLACTGSEHISRLYPEHQKSIIREQQHHPAARRCSSRWGPKSCKPLLWAHVNAVCVNPNSDVGRNTGAPAIYRRRFRRLRRRMRWAARTQLTKLQGLPR